MEGEGPGMGGVRAGWGGVLEIEPIAYKAYPKFYSQQWAGCVGDNATWQSSQSSIQFVAN